MPTRGVTSDARFGDRARPARGSLLLAEATSTFLINLKRAENGDGYILRFLNPASEADTVRVSLPGTPIVSAERVLANEQPFPAGEGAIQVQSGAFALQLTAFALETVRVRHSSRKNCTAPPTLAQVRLQFRYEETNEGRAGKPVAGVAERSSA